MTKELKMRKGVGMVLVNKAGKIFVAERADTKGAWQLPQGGLDEGEDTLEAARRELLEETGLTPEQMELVSLHPAWLSYELPKKFRKKGWDGQEQKWFCFVFKGEDGEIDLSKATHKEFKNWKWESGKWLLENVADFRKEVYEEFLKYFKEYVK